MKDYSKVKYVKPSVDGENITKGKVYKFKFESGAGGIVAKNNLEREYIFIPMCAHINDMYWIPCDEDGNDVDLDVDSDIRPNIYDRYYMPHDDCS